MTTLALHIDHRRAPGDDAGVANAVAEILTRPCFAALTRVAVNAKDRDKKHEPKTASAIVAALLAPDSDAAVLDSGRNGELVASARLWTGRRIKDYDEPKPLLGSYVVIPYDPAQRTTIVDAFADLTRSLEAAAGYIAVEPDHSRGHAAVLSQPPPRADVRDFPRRAQERKGHFWHDKNLAERISGPDWGLVLGPGHLAQLTDLSAFALVRDTGRAKLVLLTADPEDALRETFDEPLETARRMLAPVLMDVSGVPVG